MLVDNYLKCNDAVFSFLTCNRADMLRAVHNVESFQRLEYARSIVDKGEDNAEMPMISIWRHGAGAQTKDYPCIGFCEICAPRLGLGVKQWKEDEKS